MSSPCKAQLRHPVSAPRAAETPCCHRAAVIVSRVTVAASATGWWEGVRSVQGNSGVADRFKLPCTNRPENQRLPCRLPRTPIQSPSWTNSGDRPGAIRASALRIFPPPRVSSQPADLADFGRRYPEGRAGALPGPGGATPAGKPPGATVPQGPHVPSDHVWTAYPPQRPQGQISNSRKNNSYGVCKKSTHDQVPIDSCLPSPSGHIHLAVGITQGAWSRTTGEPGDRAESYPVEVTLYGYPVPTARRNLASQPAPLPKCGRGYPVYPSQRTKQTTPSLDTSYPVKHP